MSLAVLSLKGGTRKMTSAVSLAAGLHADGPTFLINVDPQGSALSWSQAAEGLEFPVVTLPVRALLRRVPRLARDRGRGRRRPAASVLGPGAHGEEEGPRRRGLGRGNTQVLESYAAEHELKVSDLVREQVASRKGSEP